jgi:tetratricopeptide (TPR) repeat protein
VKATFGSSSFLSKSVTPELLQLLPSDVMLRSFMNYLGLTDADYDEKLREMGNYLWDLEQEADIASADGRLPVVEKIEAKILGQAERAHAFLEVAGSHQGLAAFVAGLGYRMTRRWSEAADHFLLVVQGSPLNGEACLELSWCLAELGRWEECELAARKSVEILPDTAASWGNLALALTKLDKEKEAREAIRRAIQLEPNDPRNRAIEEQISKGDGE